MPLENIPANVRGWTLDVMRVVRQLNRTEFATADVYAFVPTLAALHPQNNNIEAKIRQQLQVLRDLGLLEFTSKGHYRLILDNR